MALFLLLLTWQLPHFIAISLYLKEDYARGGMKVFALVHGDRTARTWIAGTSLLLLPASLLPVALGLAGPGYGVAAAATSLAFAGFALTGLRIERRVAPLGAAHLPGHPALPGGPDGGALRRCHPVSLGEALAPLNALLNAAAGTLLLFGWRAIKRGERERHRRLMIGAVAVSAVFLASYLTRVALTGTHRFPGEGWVRGLYLVILVSHTLLAVVATPMVLRSLFLGLKGRFERHRGIARFTFPVWLYVSVTGVVVYLLLYQVAPRV